MPSCAICRTKASLDKLLRMHIQAKHDERVLKCEKCEVTCKAGRKLQTHMESHRKVNCKHCDKTIPYNSRNSHTIKCVGEKKAFKCENCPATFNKADNLKVHMANKRCSVQCNLCEKTLLCSYACTLFSALRRHNDITLEKSHTLVLRLFSSMSSMCVFMCKSIL